MKNRTVWQFILLYSMQAAFAQVTPRYNLPAVPNHWECDTVFVGADVVVADSNSDVQVIWKKAISGTIGELRVMDPLHQDSALFLFHNLVARFSGEPSTRNLGKFPIGTKLFFRYTVTDTNSSRAFIGKKLYSGRNMDSVGNYISERHTSAYGRRWAAVRKIDETRVWVGFNESYPTSFDNIIVEVQGVRMVK